MIRKRLLITGLAMSMCFGPTSSAVSVKAAKNNKLNSTFRLNTEKGKASKYGYIKPATQSYATNPKSKLKKAANLPSSYGSMDKAVRNQNPFGTCWAFAGTGNFEYAVGKKENNNVDYSEEHMIQRLSKNGDIGYQITDKNTGGNEYMYSGYFTSGYGPVDDSLFPYNTEDSLLQLVPAMLSTKGDYRATDIQFFQTVSDDDTGALSDETTATVKKAVYENGSATCGITWNEDMIQSDNVSYYNSNENARDNLNHEVLIVGWDDNYSANHFTGVTKNGAWLVRNSWGSSMGKDGYYWVSYQDKSLKPSCSIKNYEKIESNDTIYNLDESGALYSQVTYSDRSKLGFINSFSLKKREKLKEVTFYESETGSKYQLFYIPVKADGSLDMDQKQAITEKKTLSYPGYHTEKITQSINVKKAAIMVMVESNKKDVGFGAEGSICDGSKQLYIPTLEKGQSYIYEDDQFIDLTDMDADFGNWSIKLITTKAEASFYSKNHRNTTDLGTYKWTGNSVTPDIGDILSEDDDQVLKEGIDYEVEYSNHIDPGTATMKVVGLGEYSNCSLTFTYTIKKDQATTGDQKPTTTTTETKPTTSTSRPTTTTTETKPTTTIARPNTTETKPEKKKITSVTGITNATYTGKAITRKIAVKSGKVTLRSGKDYKVSYNNNKNCGVATVKITGIGNYQGSVTKTFKIVPKKAVIQKLKARKKSATVTVKKNSKGITGYQIRYSYKKNLASSKYKVSKKTSYKITRLKSKKYVYVRIRAYKQVGKTKIYGSWSGSKKVKIK